MEQLTGSSDWICWIPACSGAFWGARVMSGFALLLFGAAFLAAMWTLVASVRPQLARFAALLNPDPALPALPPRLRRVTVRSMPARIPARLATPRAVA
jgi:hypothetical protein